MAEYIRIGFTGNRNGLTSEQKEKIILELNKHDNMIISHGDCVESDTDLHNLCVDYKNKNPDKKITIRQAKKYNICLLIFATT
jgi:hypothetical protein